MTHQQLKWSKRPRRANWTAGLVRLWFAEGRWQRFRVSRNLTYPGPYLACVEYGNGGWRLISRHRKLTTAKRACELYSG
jgi:hypothetical protein